MLAAQSRGERSATARFESGKRSSTKRAKLLRGLNVKKLLQGQLKCGICIRFQSAIERRRNYSDKWVVGAESVRTSNIKDHAKTDQHQHAMMLWKKQQATAKGLGPPAYSPLARFLSEIPEDTMAKLRVKFDLAHY